MPGCCSFRCCSPRCARGCCSSMPTAPHWACSCLACWRAHWPWAGRGAVRPGAARCARSLWCNASTPGRGGCWKAARMRARPRPRRSRCAAGPARRATVTPTPASAAHPRAPTPIWRSRIGNRWRTCASARFTTASLAWCGASTVTTALTRATGTTTSPACGRMSAALDSAGEPGL
jgi:hypothetical protein